MPKAQNKPDEATIKRVLDKAKAEGVTPEELAAKYPDDPEISWVVEHTKRPEPRATGAPPRERKPPEFRAVQRP